MRAPHPPLRSERGQGSLENIGVIAVAALLVVALGTVVIQSSPAVADRVAWGFCKVTTLGTGDCEEPGDLPTDDDRIPPTPCTVSSSQGGYDVSISYVVTLESGRQYVVEELSDGTFRVTAIESGGVGVGVGPGVDVSVTVNEGSYGVTAIASADVLLGYEGGHTWYAGDIDEANSILQGQIALDVADTVTGGAASPTKGLLDVILEATGRQPTSPRPDETFFEAGAEANAGANVSAVILNMGADGAAGAYLGVRTHPDGFTAYYTAEADIDFNAFHIPGFGESSEGGAASRLFEIDYDSDGNPTAARLTTGSYWESVQGDWDDREAAQVNYTEAVFELPINSDADLQIALGTLVPGGDQAFLDAARDKGYVSSNTYADDGLTLGVNATGSLLGDLGGTVSGGNTTRELVDSQYWNGSEMVDRPDC